MHPRVTYELAAWNSVFLALYKYIAEPQATLRLKDDAKGIVVD